jgi:hypothetical protein
MAARSRCRTSALGRDLPVDMCALLHRLPYAFAYKNIEGLLARRSHAIPAPQDSQRVRPARLQFLVGLSFYDSRLTFNGPYARTPQGKRRVLARIIHDGSSRNR